MGVVCSFASFLSSLSTEKVSVSRFLAHDGMTGWRVNNMIDT